MNDSKAWPDLLDFGRRLRRLREERNMGAIFVANALGIPVTTYREWENGRSIRGLPYPAMTKIFQIGLCELLTGEKTDRREVLEEMEKLETQMRKLKERLYSAF